MCATPDALDLRVDIDGVVRQRANTRDLVRPIAQAAGRRHRIHDARAGRRAAGRRPRRRAAGARAGSASRSRSMAWARSRTRWSPRTTPRAPIMKRARVAYAGAMHDAAPHAAGAAACRRPRRGRRCRRVAAAVRRRDDRRAGPQLRRPREGARVRRARGAAGVPEGAGRAHRPSRADAPACRRHVHALRVRTGRGHRQAGRATCSARTRGASIAGYTVANDYAIRDYLENYYRPNLRVKNRDTCTVLGPWLVDAADVPDPAQPRAAHDGQRHGRRSRATRATSCSTSRA